MKTKLAKVLSILLTVAMLLSLVACNSKNENNSAQQDGSSSLSGDIAAEQEGDSLIVARSADDLGISAGVKLSSGDGVDKDLGEEIGKGAFDEIELKGERYLSPVASVGEKVEGNTRTITVYNTDNGIIYRDFQKIGCNVFPTMFTTFAQNRTTAGEGEIAAYIELNAKRFNDMHASYARSFFQIDWMMTNKAGDDYVKYENNPEDNPDYKAYNNGEYDFDNENMQSCIKYWRMLGEAGTRVEVSFGWKVADRIQSWFGEDPSRPQISAPKDLERYADAASAMFAYCKDQGLANVDILGFYNEPQQKEDHIFRDSWDFATVGDKRVYWGQMARLARKALNEKGLENVEIWGSEAVSEVKNVTDPNERAPGFDEKFLNVYLYNHYSDIINTYSFHEYYATYIGDNPNDGCYSNFYVAAGKARNLYKDAKLAVTEFYAASPEATVWGYDWDGYGGWNSSYCSYLIALANNGWHTGLSWGFVGGWLGDPLYGLRGNAEHSAWLYPHTVESAAKVQHNFYNISILNNYIPDKANVHNMTYQGQDLHAAAFTSEDGKDFSLLLEKNEVEKNKVGEALNFKVNLEESLGGRDINVFRFTFEDSLRNTNRNIQATIPTLHRTIEDVESYFEYAENTEEKGKYTIYIFTTLEPLAQIELYNAATGAQAVASELNANSSISIEPTLIDCPSDTKVEWEIKEYTVLSTERNELQKDKIEEEGADIGKITTVGNTVTYTPPADAKNGDVVALRATIEGTNRFASAIIHIVK